MKRRTVLNRLEMEGVISPPLASRLRQAVAADVAPSGSDSVMLVSALLQPDRPDTRRAIKHDFAIALEHAYYSAAGDAAATKHTADEAKIPKRTVSNAVHNSRVPKALIPTLVDMLKNPERWKSKSPREMAEMILKIAREKPNPIEIRNAGLRKGLARIRQRTPSPRGGGNKTP